MGRKNGAFSEFSEKARESNICNIVTRVFLCWFLVSRETESSYQAGIVDFVAPFYSDPSRYRS